MSSSSVFRGEGPSFGLELGKVDTEADTDADRDGEHVIDFDAGVAVDVDIDAAAFLARWRRDGSV